MDPAQALTARLLGALALLLLTVSSLLRSSGDASILLGSLVVVLMSNYRSKVEWRHFMWLG